MPIKKPLCDYDGVIEELRDSDSLSGAAVGEIRMKMGFTLTPGFLWCDAAAVSRIDFADLFVELNPSLGTVTISNATPAVVTLSSHGFTGGETIYFLTDGALPAGLSPETIYFVTRINSSTFKLSADYSSYRAGTFIDTSDAGSGIHTLIYSPFGNGDGGTTFNTPNGKAMYFRGVGQNSFYEFFPFNYEGPSKFGAIQLDMFQGHWHAQDGNVAVNDGADHTCIGNDNDAAIDGIQNPITDGVNGTPRTGIETRPFTMGVNYIIKY